MMSTGILQEKAIKSAGGAKELKRKVERYHVNVRFVEENKKELLDKFDKQWIAAYNGKVIANSSELPLLMRTIKKKSVPQDEVLVEFLTSEKVLTLYIK